MASLITRLVTVAVLLVSTLGTGRAELPSLLSSSVDNQLWLVDTRCASNHSSVAQAVRLKYWQRDSSCQWRPSTLPELLGTDDPSTTTLIYVHENRVTRSESFQRATTVFTNLSRRVPVGHSFRMIAVSWPSDRIGVLPRPDAQTKAQRSEAHGLYLAWLIDRIHPDVSIGLFGMSFGPRMITAALHHLGGGSIDGRCLHSRVHPVRKPVRIALAAAALDANWLLPGQHHGQALSQVDSTLLLVNPKDSVLRFYPRLYGHRGPQALGYVGLNSQRYRLSDQNLIVECNVSGQISGTHKWTAYEGSPSMMTTMVKHLIR